MNEMQFPVCAPWITEHMLKPEYWIEQVEDTEDLIALIADLMIFMKAIFLVKGHVVINVFRQD